MKVTHENGYTGEMHRGCILLVYDPEDNLVARGRHCSANTEDKLLRILGDMPSFLKGIQRKREEESEDE